VNINGMNVTKTNIRTDIKYMKILLRQMERSIVRNDWDDLADTCNDLGACAFSIIDAIGSER
jgi:hypothetical protein